MLSFIAVCKTSILEKLFLLITVLEICSKVCHPVIVLLLCHNGLNCKRFVNKIMQRLEFGVCAVFSRMINDIIITYGL